LGAVGDALKDTLKMAGEELGDAIADTAGKALSNLAAAGTAAVKSAMSLLQGTESKIKARL
jgi:hypothetical protein